MFLLGVVLSIYEVFFIANIRLNVIGFFTSLMLKTMPEQAKLRTLQAGYETLLDLGGIKRR